MSEPINTDRQIFGYFHSGIGLSASFADEYAKYFNEDIGLIPCADGGTSLQQWMLGELLYDNAVAQAKLAQRTSEIVGILWHQGENDSGSIETVEAYHNKFMTMINSLINDLNLPHDIPIIVGELGDFVGEYENGKLKYYVEINSVLHRIASELERGGIASAKGLVCKNDGIHFNSKSYREFGKRYFEVYRSIKR